MANFNTSIATVAAAVLLSGTAFAATLQPAAGEAPFFNAPVVTSHLQRQDVQDHATLHMPASGEFSSQAAMAQESTVTRDGVRAATLDAISHGHAPAAGTHS